MNCTMLSITLSTAGCNLCNHFVSYDYLDALQKLSGYPDEDRIDIE